MTLGVRRAHQVDGGVDSQNGSNTRTNQQKMIIGHGIQSSVASGAIDSKGSRVES
jgi:hypothetical protein